MWLQCGGSDLVVVLGYFQFFVPVAGNIENWCTMMWCEHVSKYMVTIEVVRVESYVDVHFVSRFAISFR